MSKFKLPLTQLFEIALIDMARKKFVSATNYTDNKLFNVVVWSKGDLWDGKISVEFLSEYKFHDKRKWRGDWFSSTLGILIEIDGGTFKTTVAKKGKFTGKVFVGARHNIGKGFINDCEKLNCAASLGYRVYRIANERQINQVIDYLEMDIRNYFASCTATGDRNNDTHLSTTSGKRSRFFEPSSR